MRYPSTSPMARLIRGDLKHPETFLGPHALPEGGVRVRFFHPGAVQVHVVPESGRKKKMERTHPEGLFETTIAGVSPDFDYRITVVDQEGTSRSFEDPYHPKFARRFSDVDAHLFAKGEHWKIYEKMGGRLVEHGGVCGVNFCVWAPNARSVGVAGSWNGWDGRGTPMKLVHQSGIWEIFVPELKEGTLYKFAIKAANGRVYMKSDPYGLSAQMRPKKSSVVCRLDRFSWADGDWLKRRAEADHYDRPMAIYEIHLGSWIRKTESDTPFYNYREIAEDLVPYLRDLGYTHVELLPVMEHPLDESWGYQVTNYYAPTQRHGSPEDFMFFVNKCHEHGLGVIIDWVPAHFPRDPHGLGRFDGTHLYEHADPRKGFHPDWKTYIFNYGRYEVRNFLLANALFWIEQYHVDGLRVDAVASMLYLDYSRKAGQWVPNKYGGKENLEAISFLRKMNRLVQEQFPGVVTIAEESTAWPGVTRPIRSGGLGFHYKWNMGWMHDALEYYRRPPEKRRSVHGKLTFIFHYAFSEKYVLVLSHDEVVHGKRSLVRKMPGDLPQKLANLRLLYGFMFAHPGKKLLFMGSEFAQMKEWGVGRELDWYLLDHPEYVQIQQYVRDLNALYGREPALSEMEHHPRGFRWIDGADAANGVISFLRTGRNEAEALIFVFNNSNRQLENYAIGVPAEGFYRDLFNSNAEIYGGTNVGNHPGKQSVLRSTHGLPAALELTLPPLSMQVFKKSNE